MLQFNNDVDSILHVLQPVVLSLLQTTTPPPPPPADDDDGGGGVDDNSSGGGGGEHAAADDDSTFLRAVRFLTEILQGCTDEYAVDTCSWNNHDAARNLAPQSPLLQAVHRILPQVLRLRLLPPASASGESSSSSSSMSHRGGGLHQWLVGHVQAFIAVTRDATSRVLLVEEDTRRKSALLRDDDGGDGDGDGDGDGVDAAATRRLQRQLPHVHTWLPLFAGSLAQVTYMGTEEEKGEGERVGQTARASLCAHATLLLLHCTDCLRALSSSSSRSQEAQEGVLLLTPPPPPLPSSALRFALTTALLTSLCAVVSPSPVCLAARLHPLNWMGELESLPWHSILEVVLGVDHTLANSKWAEGSRGSAVVEAMVGVELTTASGHCGEDTLDDVVWRSNRGKIVCTTYRMKWKAVDAVLHIIMPRMTMLVMGEGGETSSSSPPPHPYQITRTLRDAIVDKIVDEIPTVSSEDTVAAVHTLGRILPIHLEDVAAGREEVSVSVSSDTRLQRH